MKLIVHPEVEEDMATAASHYDGIDIELGDAFVAEVYRCVAVAQSAPLIYPAFFSECRRVPCRRFPYRVIYEVIEDAKAIHVLAVFHQSRHPEAWKDRLES